MIINSRDGQDGDMHKLYERHARIVGELPREIIECFYPEVLVYDAKDTQAAIHCVVKKEIQKSYPLWQESGVSGSDFSNQRNSDAEAELLDKTKENLLPMLI